MRYVDSGSRDPKDALGTYLSEAVASDAEMAAVRVQTGFFGAGSLGFFESTLRYLAVTDGHTRFLVGSNDGETKRSAVATLLRLAGPARDGLRVGVVSFQTGFFHPKVFHFERSDGSATAYVGSANLTPAGVRSQHVEAGIVLDTRDGDGEAVLNDIARAVDRWFDDAAGGLYVVRDGGDLDRLVEAQVLGVTRPPRTKRDLRQTTDGLRRSRVPHSLNPLVAVPPVGESDPAQSATGPSAPADEAISVDDSDWTAAHAGLSPVAHWSKQLSRSDAQRRAGHQSALVALTQGDYRHQIDHTSYFRLDLFGDETWVVERTASSEPLEVAYVPIHTYIDGVDHGEFVYRISHALHRESGTNSPTTELHLEPILTIFEHSDVTGHRLEIERFSDGSYRLTISA